MARKQKPRKSGRDAYMNSEAAAALHAGMASHQAGDLDGAEQQYRRALAILPGYFDALQLLGTICLQRHDYARAISFLEKAASAQPGLPAVHCNLGYAYRAAGRLQEAEFQFCCALSADSRFEPAYTNYGALLFHDRRFTFAITLMRQLLGFSALNVSGAVLLLQCFCEIGEFSEARAFLEAAFANPGYGREDLWRLADTPRANNGLHLSWEYMSRLERMGFAAPDFLASLATMSIQMSRYELAESYARAALECDPDNLAAHVAIGRILDRRGDIEGALLAFDKVLVSDCREAVGSALHAAGDCLDRAGEYDLAWANWERGNAFMAEHPDVRHLDPMKIPSLVDAMLAWLEREDVAAAPLAALDDGRPEPVFVVSFPRSGTTLIENILGAHPAAVNFDEAPYLNNALFAVDANHPSPRGYPWSIADADAAALALGRQTYWRLIERESGDPDVAGKTVIDKVPLNSIHLAAAWKLFPRARVIFALRDPRDVCLSCFAQHFMVNDYVVHFLSLRRTAEFYSKVMTLVVRQQERLPMAMLTYRYEDLVADFRGTVGGLLDFIGLPWDERVERFHEAAAGKKIATPSFDGVRQPVHARAVGRWVNYAEQMESVRDILEPWVIRFGYRW